MELFPYSPALQQFIVRFRHSILSQSSVYFVNTSLFLPEKAKNKYSLPLSSSIYPSALLII